MSVEDPYTYLRSLGYSGSLDAMFRQFRNNTTRKNTTVPILPSENNTGYLPFPSATAPLLVTTPLAITKSGTNAAYARDPDSGLFYGVSTANGHYITSPDLVTWTDRTYSPSAFTPSLVGFEFDTTYMYVYSSTGRIYRAVKGVFNAWTEITVLGKPPLTTGRPGSLCATGGGVLLYGNYNSSTGEGSHIWRSANAGSTWQRVVTNPSGRHVHAIRFNTVTGIVWASMGDGGYEGEGLWKSSDLGLTWAHMSSNRYGIDMVFTAASEGVPALVVLEGDGIDPPHLIAFLQDGAQGDSSFPLVWYTGAPSDSASTRGTVRGINLTPNRDILYWTTTEAGTVGTNSGLYISPAPRYDRTILLADTTGAEPSSYLAGFTAGAVSQNRVWTFVTPTFA